MRRKDFARILQSSGVQAPDWINLIAPQTIVEEASEERQFEIRGFLQQAILDGYRRDSVTNPDPESYLTKTENGFIQR